MENATAAPPSGRHVQQDDRVGVDHAGVRAAVQLGTAPRRQRVALRVGAAVHAHQQDVLPVAAPAARHDVGRGDAGGDVAVEAPGGPGRRPAPIAASRPVSDPQPAGEPASPARRGIGSGRPLRPRAVGHGAAPVGECRRPAARPAVGRVRWPFPRVAGATWRGAAPTGRVLSVHGAPPLVSTRPSTLLPGPAPGPRVQHRTGSPKVSRRVSRVTADRNRGGGHRDEADEEVTVPEQLSVLLPVWAGDRPDHLTAAFGPPWTTRPDGPTRWSSSGTGRSATQLAATGSPSWSRPARCRSKWSSWSATSASGPALDAGLAACRHPSRGPDGRRRHQPAAPVRRAAADHRVRRGHRRVRVAGVRRATPDDVVGTRTPPIEPGRHPGAGPVRRPVQPPDRASTGATAGAARSAATPTSR